MATHADTSWLKNYTSTKTPPQPKQDTEKLDTVLDEVGNGDNGIVADSKTANLHERAKDLSASKHPSADERRQAREDERQAREDAQDAADKQAQQQGALKASQSKAGQIARGVNSNVQPVIDKVGALKTTGGIGLLVAILILLVFTVVQVNEAGDTRLKMFWYMLNGRATLQGRVSPLAATSVGSVATFGTSDNSATSLPVGTLPIPTNTFPNAFSSSFDPNATFRTTV